MKDRALVADTKGYGRSVHVIQQMPEPRPLHTDETLAAVIAARPEAAA